MAKRNKRRPRKTRARSKRPRRNANRQSTIKSTLVAGTRSLLSVLPGNKLLTPIADMLFTALGFTSQRLTTGNGLYNGVIGFTGLSTFTGITLANIISRSPIIARSGVQSDKKGLEFYTPFTDGKLLELTVNAQVANIQQQRSGKWGMAFIPVRDEEDATLIPKSYDGMPVSALVSVPGAVTSSVDRPLTLKFRPRPDDGEAYRYKPIDKIYGFVILSYTDESRVDYTEFTAADFAVSLTLTGRVSLAQPVGDADLRTYYDATAKFDPQPTVSLIDLYGTNKRTMFYEGTLAKVDGLCRMSSAKLWQYESFKTHNKGVPDGLTGTDFEHLSLNA